MTGRGEHATRLYEQGADGVRLGKDVRHWARWGTSGSGRFECRVIIDVAACATPHTTVAKHKACRSMIVSSSQERKSSSQPGRKPSRAPVRTESTKQGLPRQITASPIFLSIAAQGNTRILHRFASSMREGEGFCARAQQL